MSCVLPPFTRRARGCWCRSPPRSFRSSTSPNGSCAGSWPRRRLAFPLSCSCPRFYEWTPHGLQRESEISPNESITRQAGKKLDRWIIATLALAGRALARLPDRCCRRTRIAREHARRSALCGDGEEDGTLGLRTWVSSPNSNAEKCVPLRRSKEFLLRAD